VKRPFLILGVLAASCCAIVSLSDVRGQSANPAPRTAKPVSPMKVAVIDLGLILREYKKSEDLMEDVKATAEAGNAKIKELTGKGNELAKPIQEKTLDIDSPEYLEREQKLLRLETYLKTFKATTEREMRKQGARASLEVYEDIQAVLVRYCEQNGYTLVLNFDREAMTAPESQVTRSLSQAIMFHQTRDDVTDAILGYLNHKYEAASRDSQPPAAPASPSKSAGKTAIESRPGKPSPR
jgi:Skp family chaperone for outer membrane proteins